MLRFKVDSSVEDLTSQLMGYGRDRDKGHGKLWD